MPNTYTQLLVHYVFAIRHRAAVLRAPWDEDMRKYITGVVQNYKHKMLAVNNVADHLHMLGGLHPARSVPDMMEMVKGESSGFINREGFVPCWFSWQDGYGTFSHNRSELAVVAGYIERQAEHHRKVTFMGEYRATLNDFAVEWDERYVFRELE